MLKAQTYLSRRQRAINLFKYYPVLDIKVKRGAGRVQDRFFAGQYDVVGIKPLTPFPKTTDSFNSMFGDGIFELSLDVCEMKKCAEMRKWFREGTKNTLLLDVPYPTDQDGNPLPHGAVLNFHDVPIRAQPRSALIWWLRLRYVNVPGSYPMEPHPNACGSDEPGLFGLVTQALDAGPRCPIMTVEEVQRLGALDPVGVEIDTDEWLSIEKKAEHMPDDGPKIMEIISKLQVTDEVMTGLFGLCPTDRDRAMNLFRGGNIVTDSMRITSGVTRGPNSQPVWIISCDVVASRRTRVYRTRVVFSQATAKPLEKPAGSCECVAHLGWCSHQVALLLFVNFMQLFPMTTLTSEFRRVYPPSAKRFRGSA